LALLILFSVGYLLFLLKTNLYLYNPYLFNEKERLGLDLFYGKCFPYYNLLNTKEKNKFLIRIKHIRETKEMRISPEILNTHSEVELLICAAFAQITFGFDDYEIKKFTAICVHPNTFYSKLVNNKVKGLTLGRGFILYSWEDFISGYMFENDKINLALHELAHALYIDRFRNEENNEWNQWTTQAQAELELIRNNENLSYFRAYGTSNVHELWAVSVESFFEDPLTYKKEHPQLYQTTANVLRQDMAARKILQIKENNY
jgi:MtfA peptidase